MLPYVKKKLQTCFSLSLMQVFYLSLPVIHSASILALLLVCSFKIIFAFISLYFTRQGLRLIPLSCCQAEDLQISKTELAVSIYVRRQAFVKILDMLFLNLFVEQHRHIAVLTKMKKLPKSSYNHSLTNFRILNICQKSAFIKSVQGR